MFEDAMTAKNSQEEKLRTERRSRAKRPETSGPLDSRGGCPYMSSVVATYAALKRRSSTNI